MAFRAKENILQFKKGQIVEEIQDNWKQYFEEIDSKPVVKEEPVEEIKEELVVKDIPKPKKKKRY